MAGAPELMLRWNHEVSIPWASSPASMSMTAAGLKYAQVNSSRRVHLTMTGRPAAFLDRDGTIIRDANYIRDPADVEVLPGVAALQDK